MKLDEATLRDMWAGFSYRLAQQANASSADPLGRFVVMSVLFLSQDAKPANRPDPLQFAQFIRSRLAQLATATCTEVPAPPAVSPQLLVLHKDRKVIQLVTVWTNGTVTVKEVAERQIVKGVPFAPSGDGTILVTPTAV